MAIPVMTGHVPRNARSRLYAGALCAGRWEITVAVALPTGLKKNRQAPMSFSRRAGYTQEIDMCSHPGKERKMLPLAGKKMVVIGGSRGVGRRIVEAAIRSGARVLAVARQEGPLRQLAQEVSGTEVLSLDATDESAPSKVFDVVQPDILVLCGGAFPPSAPLHQQSWREFAVNWETDVKIAFHFLKAALSRPLPVGASIILISSGAALAGSPNSGGYAGAKRTQIFMANYSQKESDRLGLGLRFMALAPRIMPDTELGKHAVAGYSRYLGIPAADFIQSMASPPASSDVAAAVIELATNPDHSKGKVFIVTGKGLEAVP
jgi:NAD(P)-dependent dehydrogenase (short-subunit alcohol dehydrogenase family)